MTTRPHFAEEVRIGRHIDGKVLRREVSGDHLHAPIAGRARTRCRKAGAPSITRLATASMKVAMRTPFSATTVVAKRLLNATAIRNADSSWALGSSTHHSLSVSLRSPSSSPEL